MRIVSGGRHITTIESTAPRAERVGVVPPTACGALRITAQPNRALSREQRLVAAVAMTVPVAASAAFVAAHGGWLVLPFAGIEVAVIWAAWRWLRLHDADFERVEVSGDRLTLERRIGTRLASAQMNRPWVAVVYQPAGITRKGVLALRSHGRVYPVGELMTEEERAAAARELATAVGRSASRR